MGFCVHKKFFTPVFLPLQITVYVTTHNDVKVKSNAEETLPKIQCVQKSALCPTVILFNVSPTLYIKANTIKYSYTKGVSHLLVQFVKSHKYHKL